MLKYEDLYCKLFIDTDTDRESLINVLKETVNGKNEDWTIESKYTVIDVKRNVAFDMCKRNELPDGFLYFRYFLDIEPKENTMQDDYISIISNMLQSLWDLGYKAVAACDFEEDLPRKGGYNYKDNI